jgi:hypothetical protein
MSNNARPPVIMGETDIVARLTKRVYGGAKIIYDDKAKAVDLSRYGVFWKAQKNFLIGLEYNQMGDRTSLDATFNHKINQTTSVGSMISLDLGTKLLQSSTVVEKRLDDGNVVKGKVDSRGGFDVSLSSALGKSLTATLTTGGTISSILEGQASRAYTGIALNFAPV